MGLLAQEAHFDEAFAVCAGPADGRPARRRRGSRRWRPSCAPSRRRTPPGPPDYAELQHAVRGPRRLHPRPAGRRGAVGPRLHARRDRPLARGAVGRAADPGGARPAPRRRPGPAPPRRAHEPPRPRRPRVARGGRPAPPRRAPRRLARPGLPRRDRDAHLGAARPAPDGLPRRLLRLRPPARGARRAAPPRGRDPRLGDRAASRRSSRRYRSQRKHGKMHEHEARLARLGPDRGAAVRALAAPRPGPRRSRPPRSGEVVAAHGGPRRRAPGRPRRRPGGAPGGERAGERIGIVGPNGAGKTTLLRTIAGRAPAARRAPRLRRQRPARLPRPGARRTRSPARRSSTRCSARSP